MTVPYGTSNPKGAHNRLFFIGGPNGYANRIFVAMTFRQ